MLPEPDKFTRSFLRRVWIAARLKQPLKWDEEVLARVLEQHTDWHEFWLRADELPDDQYLQDGADPLWHVYTHFIVEMMRAVGIETVNQAYDELLEDGYDPHAALHYMCRVYMETILAEGDEDAATDYKTFAHNLQVYSPRNPDRPAFTHFPDTEPDLASADDTELTASNETDAAITSSSD